MAKRQMSQASPRLSHSTPLAAASLDAPSRRKQLCGVKRSPLFFDFVCDIMHVVSADTLSAEQLPVGALQDSNQSLSAQLESVAKAICKARRVAVVCGALRMLRSGCVAPTVFSC